MTSASDLKIVIVGGGFSGTLFALKAHAALPRARIAIVEKSDRIGKGLAYGLCAPSHLLNVPVSRMEVGLEPGFQAWLAGGAANLAAALAESGGDLPSAFVERALFGAYLHERLEAALRDTERLAVVSAEVVGIEEVSSRSVVLGNGRRLAADIVVLATGNLTPRPLGVAVRWPEDIPSDPWAPSLFDGMDPKAPLLLVGTGLTAVDVALKLTDNGHAGRLTAVSRHGLIPQAHVAGGHWPPFLDRKSLSPLDALRAVRAAAADAAAQGIAWQRVIDAVRPSVAGIWHRWSPAERRQFLRHVRPRWDVVRHRMAPRIAARLHELMRGGRLHVLAGRMRAAVPGTRGIDVTIDKRGGGREDVRVARIVNCTGPRSDYATIDYPLFADLRRRKLIVPDPLALGIETEDCAVVDSRGGASDWHFALGSLTRPAWWEITAVPEINVQIGRLVGKLSASRQSRAARRALLAEEFVDLGAGI
ncbi:MAG: FAD/NAD(P)-binding protein [Rhizomicrobium sp.]